MRSRHGDLGHGDGRRGSGTGRCLAPAGETRHLPSGRSARGNPNVAPGHRSSPGTDGHDGDVLRGTRMNNYCRREHRVMGFARGVPPRSPNGSPRDPEQIGRRGTIAGLRPRPGTGVAEPRSRRRADAPCGSGRTARSDPTDGVRDAEGSGGTGGARSSEGQGVRNRIGRGHPVRTAHRPVRSRPGRLRHGGRFRRGTGGRTSRSPTGRAPDQ